MSRSRRATREVFIFITFMTVVLGPAIGSAYVGGWVAGERGACAGVCVWAVAAIWLYTFFEGD